MVIFQSGTPFGFLLAGYVENHMIHLIKARKRLAPKVNLCLMVMPTVLKGHSVLPLYYGSLTLRSYLTS